jgi:hypothetical protein
MSSFLNVHLSIKHFWLALGSFLTFCCSCRLQSKSKQEKQHCGVHLSVIMLSHPSSRVNNRSVRQSAYPSVLPDFLTMNDTGTCPASSSSAQCNGKEINQVQVHEDRQRDISLILLHGFTPTMVYQHQQLRVLDQTASRSARTV